MGYMTILPLACVFALAFVFVLRATPTLCYVAAGARRQSTSLPHGAVQTYIVLVEPPAHAHADEAAHRRWHESFLLGSRALSDSVPRPIRHSYTDVLSGFAARLTDDELAAVSRKRGFVRAFPERRLPLMMTRTPGLLGLDAKKGAWSAASYGKGTIVGLLDTSIAAEHPSFGDECMPPPPAKWKGTCQPPARCNNKLVGTESFIGDNNTNDDVGHGTHTAGMDILS